MIAIGHASLLRADGRALPNLPSAGHRAKERSMTLRASGSRLRPSLTALRSVACRRGILANTVLLTCPKIGETILARMQKTVASTRGRGRSRLCLDLISKACESDSL